MKRVLLSVLVGCLLAATAGAQPWSGGAALEVRVEDQRGKAAAGAEVRLQYLGVEPPDGPPPLVTDERGRATIGGLAEGLWRLDVARSGFMTYRAEVEVREGKPRVVAAGQHNVPGAVHTLSVRVAKGRGGAPPPQIARREEPPAPAPPVVRAPPPAPEPATPEPAPREAPVTAPTPAPAQPQAPAEPPAPVPPPVAAPRESPPVEAPPSPAPSPEPMAPPSEPPVAPAPQAPPSPAPAPAPAAPPVEPPPRAAPPAPSPPVPAPAPAPEPPAAPTLRRRSYDDGTCADCRPGESAASVAVVVQPPAPGSACAEALRQAYARERAALPDEDVPSGLPASCPMLEVRLAPGVRYTGYRYEVQDGDDIADCLAGRDCPVGDAVWPFDPVLRRSAAGETVLTAGVENRSPARPRRAIFTVYYVPERGKR